MKLLLMLCLLLSPLFPAEAQENTQLNAALDTTLKSLDLSALPSAFQHLLGDETALRQLLQKLSSGQQVLDMHTLMDKLLKQGMHTLHSSLRRLGSLMIPAVLCSMLERMRHALSRAKVGEMLEYACFLSIAAVMAKDLSAHLHISEGSISRMADAMQALFPLLLTLLSAVGSTAGASFYHPALTAAGGTMITLVRSFTLKLALAHGAVTILSHISDRLHLDHLNDLLHKTATWTLGVAFTLFLSVTTLQGISSAVTDGISIRTAKYAVDHFVPVVGGMFADTMDALIGSSLLVKNALGVTGMVALMLLCAGPLLETLCASWVYRLSAGILEPLAPRRISRCMHAFGQVLTLFFIIQLSVAAMFFLLIAQLLSIGNLIVMLR